MTSPLHPAVPSIEPAEWHGANGVLMVFGFPQADKLISDLNSWNLLQWRGLSRLIGTLEELPEMKSDITATLDALGEIMGGARGGDHSALVHRFR